ncbi:MAG: hypothetical protein AAF665_17925 [Pseudomonadota bacterium]
MKFQTLVIAMCSIAIAVPAAAAAFRAVNWLYVVPVSQDSFEVLEDRGQGARGMWCAAADYARAAGLYSPQKRMYILEPRGPSRTTPNAIGVVFTTNPDDSIKDTPSSYSVTVKRKGENLLIGHAYEFCRQPFDDVFDRF